MSNEAAYMKQLIVNFKGRVQGVGFRYMTLQLARTFSVCGYVRNLPDGSVEVKAEGDESVVKAFLEAIQQSRLSHHIESFSAEWKEGEGKWERFEIH